VPTPNSSRGMKHSVEAMLLQWHVRAEKSFTRLPRTLHKSRSNLTCDSASGF
jgi:hypothetical protein